jgi:hypothetical protein
VNNFVAEPIVNNILLKRFVHLDLQQAEGRSARRYVCGVCLCVCVYVLYTSEDSV